MTAARHAKRSASSARSLVWQEIRAAGPMLLLGTLLLAGAGVTGLVQPLVGSDIIEATGRGDSISSDVRRLVLLVALGAVLLALGNYLVLRASEDVVLGVRNGLVRQIFALPFTQARRMPPGDLMSRVTSDTSVLRQIATQTVVQAFTGLVMLIGAIVMMARLDLVLLGVTAGVVLGTVLISALVMPRIRRAAVKAQTEVGAIGSTLERGLSGFGVVKAYGAEDLETARVTDAARAARGHGLVVARWAAVAGTAAGLATQIAFLLVLVVGGGRAASGAISIATLITFLLYVSYLAQPAMQLTNAGTYLQMGRAAAERIRQVTSLPVEEVDAAARASSAPALPSDDPHEIAFEGVTFRHPDAEHNALDDVSFVAPGRGLTAIVGPSGAGKTTLLHLVQGFLEPRDGRLLIGGRDALCRSLRARRADLGFVDQDCVLLDGSLRDNVRYGNPNATDDELRFALSAARLNDLLERLPDGLDSPIGVHGTALSGGERQRVAIARAMVRRPAVLLMDEATAHLDAGTEEAVRASVADFARSRSVVVVAHRLSTVRDADQIIVMDDGRVRAIGTHDDLMERDSMYQSFARAQELTRVHHA